MTGRSLDGAVGTVGVVGVGYQRLSQAGGFAAVSRRGGAPRPVRQ